MATKNTTKSGESGAESPATASQTLVRGLNVIEAVAKEPASDIGIIAERTGMTYSTAHRIVSVLMKRQYLKRVPGKGYRLGRKILALGFQAYGQVEITRAARPVMERLSRETSDTIHLACEEQGMVFYLDKIASRRPVEITSRVGGMKPLITTGVGKALLLDGTVESWLELYDREARKLGVKINRKQWLALMQSYAQAGHTYDLGEDEPSIHCVAAPIRDGSHTIIAAISVSSTLAYMPRERMQALVPVVIEAAAQITAELGG
ncbi:MAG: IclR family transcriptional regulator [Alcaligenaceae bacterium]|nr:IclR family transcriptional regulator [Alcaligenaceae bacterium]